MYPKLSTLTVRRRSTLREFIGSLWEDALYAYDRRLVGVLVNGAPRWPSSAVEPGDTVTVFPIMTGG